MKTLHFTIGPVQSFVAQSRQTRDLLVSSFLLSYLAGVAMLKVIDSGGRIVFPAVYGRSGQLKYPLLQVMKGQSAGNKPIWLGTLPNRFKAEIPDSFDPKDCVREVERVWGEIAESVRNFLMEKVKKMKPEEQADWNRSTVWEIWDEQVRNFWEMAWVLSEQNHALDLRKNWRTYFPPVQKRAKCTLMSEWDEISGYREASNEQRDFWKALDRIVGEKDLDSKERLSAPALIKRFFPYCAKSVLGIEFPDEIIHLPSFHSIAVTPWLRHVDSKNGMDKAKKYKKLIDQYFPSNERKYQTLNLKTKHAITLAQMDSRYLLSYSLETAITEKNLPDKQKEIVKETYQELCEQAGMEPSPYYALLMMDGDRFGEMLQREDPVRISEALGRFTDNIMNIVREKDGVTIYTGGDDVLVMLPMQKGLACAAELHEAFAQEFRSISLPVTSSTALLFAHCQAPLVNVLEFARYLLEEVAKEYCNRDSLAIGVHKRIGAELVWSAPWEGDETKESSVRRLAELLGSSGSDKRASVVKEMLSNQFLMKFVELEHFPYYPNRNQFNERKQLMKEYIVSEMKRILGEKENMEIYHDIADAMLQVSFQSRRTPDGQVQIASGPYSSTAAQLIKFIREQEGVIQ
ncbi:MAG: type III-B CRISPR-associated protein Cas10/Cmr2 [Thermoactinomyces sp.]